MSDFPIPPEETGREHLRRAVAGLPSHEPEAATWLHIAAQLDAEAAIAQAIPTLPAHEPDDALWNAITSRLDEAEAPAAAVVFRPLWPTNVWRRVASIAAVILLLLGVWWLRPIAPTKRVAAVPHETVTFSEEEVAAPFPAVWVAPASDPLAQEGKDFIDAHCTSLPTVCQSDEFRELRAQLSEVEEQERQLRQDAQRFGASPALVRQQVQLTTLRATLTRELVQLLIS
ncbi:hypothetical protein MUN82_17030 [Hymenobacter aerilatus]|uniref:Uncharacterized protein n=1 Tax=Hymenobacter aerilatus TaxID=2932251 RepID=A0A8T9SWU5_9BACT|nr:hypothetical protein [Hymenobacter aerilatus]UOR04640.1 hypothetical protein MUN82_17030 [Hymenobacter aerilatus]